VNSGYGQKRELHESEMVTGRFADRTFSRQVVTSEINLRGLSVETTGLNSTIGVKKRSNKNKKRQKRKNVTNIKKTFVNVLKTLPLVSVIQLHA